MAQKGKSAAGAKKAAPQDEIDYNEVLRFNYKRACTATGIPPTPAVTKLLNPEDAAQPLTELSIDSPAGPEACIALLAAVLAKGSGMKPVAYKHVKTLRFVGANCGDEGAAAVADVLSTKFEPGCSAAVESVELVDCGVAPTGCSALGRALMLGAGGSFQLRSLRLDLNRGLGDAGCALLCRGLETNHSLQRLSLTYCGLSPAGAASLASVLGSPYCALQSLNLQGNRIGPTGLLAIAAAAKQSKTLSELTLTDNAIGLAHLGLVLGKEAAAPKPPPEREVSVFQRRVTTTTANASLAAQPPALVLPASREDAVESGDPSVSAHAVSPTTEQGSPGTPSSVAAAAAAAVAAEAVIQSATDAQSHPAAAKALTPLQEALDTLGAALGDAACPLSSVHLDMNHIPCEDISRLLPHLQPSNAKVKVFRVDVTLPQDVFKALTRTGAAPAKKGKAAAKAKK